MKKIFSALLSVIVLFAFVSVANAQYSNSSVPIEVTNSITTNDSVKFTFKETTLGAGDSYLVSCAIHGGYGGNIDTPPVNAFGTSSPITVSPLKPDSDYSCTMMVKTSNDQYASQSRTLVISTKIINIEKWDASWDSIKFWLHAVPLTVGDAYIASCYDTNFSRYSVSGTSNVLTLGSLKPNTTYVCHGLIENSNGDFIGYGTSVEIKTFQQVGVGSSADDEAVDEQEISEGQPDLTLKISKVNLVKRLFRGGVTKKQYKLHLLVTNIGEGPVDGAIYYSYGKKGQNAVTKLLPTNGSGLDAGKGRKVFVYVDATEKGASYVFTVDPKNLIEETSESNNEIVQVVIKK